MRRPLAATVALFLTCAALPLTPGRAQVAPAPKTAAPHRELPGVQAGGSVLLPNQWSLHPAGKQVPLGDFPVNLALHPGGRWLAVLHAGYGEHEVHVVELGKQKARVVSRVALDQTFLGL